MALKVQSSFSAGELDPALHERTTFDKYQSGLATARNEIVGKTGRLVSRAGRAQFKKTKLSNRTNLIFSPPNTGYLIEFGHLYVRTYDFSGTLINDVAHAYSESDLPYIHFIPTGSFVYIFREGLATRKFNFTTGAFVTDSLVFRIAPPPITASLSNGGTGYDVEYAVTITDLGNNVASNAATGLEQEGFTAGPITGGKLPIAAGEVNVISIPPSTSVLPLKANVYRRPAEGGIYGYIGSTTYYSGTAFEYKDNGEAADYSHTDPAAVYLSYSPSTYLSKTGAIYQQRLLMGLQADPEAIIASRPGLQNNFRRDYPLNNGSALAFKSGTSGRAKILRMLDNDGLVVFTTVGIYLSAGELGPANLSLARKGGWIIDENVPPLGVPGGVIFIDSATNTVRQLSWSTEQASYSGNELSTYSNHLFVGRRVVSWGFEEGDLACLWVVYDDGEYASFTYEPEQQMRAWTRHDSAVTVEAVAGTGYANKTFFLVEKDGERYIEHTVPRYISAATLSSDPEAYMGHSVAAMDSMLSYRTLLNDSIGNNQFQITPVVPGDWEDELELICGTAGIFTTGTYGAVGTIMRFFDPDDGSSIDLEVLSRINDNTIRVQPSAKFPIDYNEGFRLYATANVLTGLSHLEGEYPSVVVDGYVICSPNNDDQNYPSAQVIGGELTLPNDIRGAIVHVGRPIVYDVETLDIDSVEQRPILIESKTLNKMYVKVYNSGGLYYGNRFTKDDKVDGMKLLDQIDINYDDVEVDPETDIPELILGNRFQEPTTKRYEATLPGDWRSQGRTCIRSVDPIHHEILSIIPDVEDLRR